MTTTRYTVSLIADAHCNSLARDVIAATDDLAAAKAAARAAIAPYGAGIRDTQTGEIDVGFGFGVPVPGDDEAEIEHDFAEGDRVEAGETAADYDTGRVVETDGDQITVAWDSGVRTTQRADVLRAEGARPIAA